MKDETIVEILNALNTGNRDCGDLVYGEIAKDVFRGFFYEKTPDLPFRIRRKEMFFVKSGDGAFSGAVYWHDSDNLHWLVLPEKRGKGLLTAHLQDSILPFIFDNNPEMTVQRATLLLGRPQAAFSARLAEKVGFKKVESNEERVVFELSKDAVKQPFHSIGKGRTNPEVRSKMIREMESAFAQLDMIADEFEVKIGCKGDRHLLGRVRKTNRETMDFFQHMLRNGGSYF